MDVCFSRKVEPISMGVNHGGTIPQQMSINSVLRKCCIPSSAWSAASPVPFAGHASERCRAAESAKIRHREGSALGSALTIGTLDHVGNIAGAAAHPVTISK